LPSFATTFRWAVILCLTVNLGLAAAAALSACYYKLSRR
jgi:hypothetical protein